MTEYTAGDLVEAVKGESVIRGRLIREGLHLWVGDSGRTPENIESYGFTVSVVEKAAAVVVLPTEPGLYRGADYKIWRLSKIGNWNLAIPGEQPLAIWEAELLIVLPLTPLAPVSETAKKVLDRVRIILHLGRPFVMSSLDDIGEEFGATK